MAKHWNSTPRQGHALWQQHTKITSIYYQGVQNALTKFEVDLINSLGGVC